MIVGLLVALGVAAGSPSALDQLHAAVEAAPKDVKTFIIRRSGCNHFGGEEPYNPERAAELNKAARDLRCKTTAQDERKLRAKYVKSPAILKLLDDTKDDLGW